MELRPRPEVLSEGENSELEERRESPNREAELRGSTIDAEINKSHSVMT